MPPRSQLIAEVLAAIGASPEPGSSPADLTPGDRARSGQVGLSLRHSGAVAQSVRAADS